MSQPPLLQVDQLKVSFKTHMGPLQAVRDVSFAIYPGESVAIVGESGSGKSVAAKAIIGLLSDPGVTIDGRILLNEENLLEKSEKEMQKIRGNQIGMIFQDPMTSLNPTMRVGKQILEVIHKHAKSSFKESKQQAIQLLQEVGLSDPEKRFEQYPHELSGGMRQRVLIAIALACTPKLLIADEPTTALDVTIQAQILAQMKAIQHKNQMSILLITHDLGIVAGMCDRVIVMYGGMIVETASVEDIYHSPFHPYTQGLLNSIPRVDKEESDLTPIPGAPPHLLDLPAGCPFTERCPFAMRMCPSHRPALFVIKPFQQAACWLHKKNP